MDHLVDHGIIDSAAPDPAAAPRCVVEVDPERDPRWLGFLEAHPDPLVYHHPLWLRTLRREYPQDLLGLMCLDAVGDVVGVMPLLHTRGLPLKLAAAHGARRLSSLPRTPVAGPLALDAAAAADLVLAALEHAQRSPRTHLQVKLAGHDLPDRLGPLRARPWRRSFVLDLPSEVAGLRFGNAKRHGRIVWAVHKAAREGVEVRPPVDVDELRRWYRLYLATMRHHAVPPRPFRLFEAAWELLMPAGLMTMLLAVRPGPNGASILAGSIFLRYGTTVFYAFNGRRSDSLALRPNDAILHRAIVDAVETGFARFDLGEVVSGGTGLAEFKSKWGAATTTLRRYYHPDPEHGDGAGPPPAAGSDEATGGDADAGGTGRLSTLARSAWKRLPMAVTAVIGERLYRYL